MSIQRVGLVSLAGVTLAISVHAQSTATPSAPAPAPRAAVGAGAAAVNTEAPLESEPVPVVGKWSPLFYGFVDFDSTYDTTQSFNDLAGNAAIARKDTLAGKLSRSTFGVRNSRIGFKLAAPESVGLKASAILEMDFLGNQPPTATEAATFTSPSFRVRHFALKLDNEVVTVLLGQYWQLFGWQSNYHPNTVEIQGAPGEVFTRAPQIRLSHLFNTDAVGVEVAVAGSRPVSRDSGVPDGEAGLRVLLNHWKGLHTAGATGTAVDPLSVGVSTIGRRFRVPAYQVSPQSTVSKSGWGVSMDALLPVIPATLKDRGNALTLTGSWVTGTGIADLYTGLTTGVIGPALPNSTDGKAQTYTSNIDPGLIEFDGQGHAHTIDWQSFLIGVQYYLPPSGRVWVSSNLSHMKAKHIADVVELQSIGKVYSRSDWADACLFWDVTTAVRLGAEYAYFHQTYGDGESVHNLRGQFSGFYIF